MSDVEKAFQRWANANPLLIRAEQAEAEVQRLTAQLAEAQAETTQYDRWRAGYSRARNREVDELRATLTAQLREQYNCAEASENRFRTAEAALTEQAREIAHLKAEREDFYQQYRQQSDVQSKAAIIRAEAAEAAILASQQQVKELTAVIEQLR